MQLIPAIDLKDGQCVRLRRGEMADATVFSEDPAAMARHWLEQAAALHGAVRTVLRPKVLLGAAAASVLGANFARTSSGRGSSAANT